VKAVFQTGSASAWVRALGLETWALAPVADRSLLEYWLELCDLLRITEVHLVLSDGAAAVETFAQDGARWGLKITYSFLDPDEDPDLFLMRSPERWIGGLFYLRAPLFPRRLGGEPAAKMNVNGTYLHCEGGRIACLASSAPDFLKAFLAGDELALGAHDVAKLGFAPEPIANLKDYFALNLRMVRGECARYVRPGYFYKDGAGIGLNVIIPPAARLQPPLIIGNNTRLSALTVIGPDVIIGSRCIVDQQSELSRCVILDGTYIGRNLEIRDKIVAGRRLIDPADGTVAAIDDPWLLASVPSTLRPADILRAVLGWPLALLLVLLQFIPFLLLGGLLKITGGWRFVRGEFHVTRQRRSTLFIFPDTDADHTPVLARLFRAASLDLFPALLRVLTGRLWLCGQEPLRVDFDDALRHELKEYFPAALSYATPRAEVSDTVIKRVDALYYAYHRSLVEDARILLRALFGRLAGLFGRVAEEPFS
jgi:hypothetical protein